VKSGWYWFKPKDRITLQRESQWVIVRIGSEYFSGNQQYVYFSGSDWDCSVEEANTIGIFGPEIPQYEA
jgi:hypothetical protein